MKSELEIYYEEHWVEGMPPFDELTVPVKAEIANTIQFTSWRFERRAKELANAVGISAEQLSEKLNAFTSKL